MTNQIQKSDLIFNYIEFQQYKISSDELEVIGKITYCLEVEFNIRIFHSFSEILIVI